MKTEEIKTWRDRITTPTTNQKNLFMSMQAEIDELRAAFANLHSDYDIIQIDREELRAELAVWIRRADKTWYEKVYTDEIATLKAKLAALEQEANEEDALRERMSGLLTKSVNAIRGEPAELSLHSWHDLPELCNRLVEKLADQTKAADQWMGEARKSHNDLVRANEKLAALEAQEPVAHICILPTKDAGPTKFFTAPSDPRGFPVYKGKSKCTNGTLNISQWQQCIGERESSKTHEECLAEQKVQGLSIQEEKSQDDAAAGAAKEQA